MKLLWRDIWAQWRLKYALGLGHEEQKFPPYFINLEPNCYCNLDCPICSYDGTRAKGYLSRETAEIALDQAQELGVFEVRLFLAGEPFFHPHLAELVASARSRGLVTLIHTNGTFMPDKRVHALMDAGLDKISFSFDGESAGEYEVVRIGAKFDDTMGKIIRFLQIKRERGGEFPLVTIQVIKLATSPEPDRITPAFKRRFEGLPVDEFLLLHPFTWPDQKQTDMARPPGSKFYPCMIPWTSLSVGWDGRVFWCCGDLNGRGVLGDIHDTTLKEIWNGEQIRAIRRGLARRELDDLELCRNCEANYHRHHPLATDFRQLWRQIKRGF